MDNLLCDEDWLIGRPTMTCTALDHDPMQPYPMTCYTVKEDICEHAFASCLQKDILFMPQNGYIDRIWSRNLIIPRLRAMQWIIKSQSRLNLSYETTFIAANCFDRFMSVSQCQEWMLWMIDLLSVACLSIATKYSETSTLTLHDIQMGDADHSFQSSTIQRMESMLLSALNWQICSSTAYTYIEIMLSGIDSLVPHHHTTLMNRVTELLLRALSDYKFVVFRPWVMAISALKCSLEEFYPLKLDNHLLNICKSMPLMDEMEDDNPVKCKKMMETAMMDHHSYYYCPPSPVTVLLTERRIKIYDSEVDISVFEKPCNLDMCRMLKRKRDLNHEKKEGSKSKLSPAGVIAKIHVV